MSSLKYAAIVGTGAAVGVLLSIAVIMPQIAGATAADVGKLIFTQWLGIGTSTPSQRLSVAGSAYVTGDVITGSGIKFSDGTTQTTAASGSSVPAGMLCGFSMYISYEGYGQCENGATCMGYNPCTSCPSGYTQRIRGSFYTCSKN